jgi:peptide/nickel transport system substrate-binding protein
MPVRRQEAALSTGPTSSGTHWGASRIWPATLGLLVALAWASPGVAETEIYLSPEVPSGITLRGPASLDEKVAAGELPPVAERMPSTPRVTSTSEAIELGKSGGELRTLVTRSKDTRLLTVYGYARLVGYNTAFELEPDILEKVEVEDGRIFTFYLRKGHRWSDGAAFTAEDFRYYWEDVANNPDLSPTGPPITLRVDGVPAVFEIIDETTVRFTWPSPNPFVLPALAGARPLFLYRPAHYLQAYHQDYGDAAKIAEAVDEAGVRNWAELHNRLDNMYRLDNPALPTLQPWWNSVWPPSTRFVAKRNSFYHRIDESGQQLPYLDKLILSVVGGALVPAKSGSGEADLQARGLNFTDYTFLKENEQRSGYDVRLWRTVRGSQLALYPNLNASDPQWRSLLRDTRFRRALSLAIDRYEINSVIYYGLCLVGNNGVLPDSPLYDEARHMAWAQFEIDQANAILDEMGMSERSDDGIRVMPDGRPLQIIVETAGENTEEVDVLELIHDSWKRIGVKLYTKPLQRENLRNRIFSGETIMAMWFGYENGVPTADMSPEEFVPVRQHSYHWPKWGQYIETGGQSGEPADMPKAKELLSLYAGWIKAPSQDARTAAWNRILDIHAEEVYTIGIVAQVPQPVLVANGLRNVPQDGIFNWDPGAQFGIYRPEIFWWDR